MSALNSRIGLAVVSALAVMLGLFLADLFGWTETDALDYVLAAAAGFVGGLIGWYVRQSRRT